MAFQCDDIGGIERGSTVQNEASNYETGPKCIAHKAKRARYDYWSRKVKRVFSLCALVAQTNCVLTLISVMLKM